MWLKHQLCSDWLWFCHSIFSCILQWLCEELPHAFSDRPGQKQTESCTPNTGNGWEDVLEISRAPCLHLGLKSVSVDLITSGQARQISGLHLIVTWISNAFKCGFSDSFVPFSYVHVVMSTSDRIAWDGSLYYSQSYTCNKQMNDLDMNLKKLTLIADRHLSSHFIITWHLNSDMILSVYSQNKWLVKAVLIFINQLN